MSFREPQTPGIGGLAELTAAEAITVQNISGLGDPGADRILFWDESSGATGAYAFLTVGSGLSISGTTITATASSPLTTKGDLWVYSTLDTRLPVGTDGFVLTADAASAAGVKWAAASGTGTVTSVSVTTANGVSGSVATATTTPAITITLGAITPTTVNGLTITSTTGTFTLTNAKTFAVTNSLTLSGTDGTTMTFPSTSATIARTDAANTFTGVQTMTSPALTTPAITGLATGNGVASAATASTLVSRDANANSAINNMVEGFTTTATAAGTTTLTITATYTQIFTGSSTQTVKLPTTSVLQGQQYFFVNLSSGAVTVQSSGANTIVIMGANTSAFFTAAVATPTTAANWIAAYAGVNAASGKVATINNTITFAGTDATTMTFPTTSATLARTDAANTFTGASTASAWVLTSPTITTGIVPTSNDGAALGSTANMFSDLFLASGAVINFNNGDVTLTHASNLLTFAGGQFTFGANTAYFTETDNGNSSTADTIDWTLSNKQKSTLTGNCTFTFTAPGGPCSLVLKLVQDGTGSRTVTWPAAVHWSGGTAPTLTTTINKVDIITFYYDGTTYFGNSSLNYTA